ncbi:YiiX/YebB-like N1pC/P60 family cysteine hydrolase [Bowmanella denitrificans]|uniref:YiiX/YebB-like N1pC/P60 family cysteine hydrolase n=1 Tax=Bowmanella denitrificans TaxID=366582 RepID=UPI000C9C0445|nr:YiiX/YebB-like N1pC/P60 family cysteine hydrolase [Bowmanella denitrificans]
MQVIYCRNNHPLSLFVRWFTWSRWSHCGIVLDGDVIHATAAQGVVCQPLTEFVRQYPTYQICTMPGTAHLAIDQLGKPYDWGGVLGIRWGKWDDHNRWFCSELVAYCSGLFRPNRRNRVTPEHCWMVSK